MAKATKHARGAGKKFPQSGESQRIGNDAKNCLMANIPESWFVMPLDGDHDYGMDALVQVNTPDGVKYAFVAQVKGSENQWSKAKKIASVKIKLTTLRYLVELPFPAMFIFCDLNPRKKDRTVRPADCKPYFKWLEPADLSASGDDQPEKVTVKVPSENALTTALDITRDLATGRRLNMASVDILELVRNATPNTAHHEQVSNVELLVNRLGRHRQLVTSLLSESNRIWPSAPENSLPWHLRKASEAMQYGDSTSAGGQLKLAEALLPCAEPAETAEFWFVKGGLLLTDSRDEEARDAFLKALAIAEDHPRYLAIWAETEIRIRFDQGASIDLADVRAKLVGDDPDIRFVRGKTLVAEERFAEVQAEIAALDDHRRLLLMAIAASTQGQLEETISICENGLRDQESLSEKEQTLLVLRVEALFLLAVGYDQAFQTLKPPKIDYAALNKVWLEYKSLATFFKTHGWLPNFEFVAEGFSQTASLLGRHSEALPLLLEAAQARPRIKKIHSALERIAAESGELEIALSANQQSEDDEPRTLRRVCLLHSASKYRECLEEFLNRGQFAYGGHPLYGVSVVLAGDAATRLFRREDYQTIQRIASGHPKAPTLLAISNFFRSKDLKDQQRETALEKLYEEYLQLNKPSEIGSILLIFLQPSKVADAMRLIEVAQDLKQLRPMLLCDVVRLAEAHSKTTNWNSMLELGEHALARFGSNVTTQSISAFALNRLGRTSEALERLESVEAALTRDPQALVHYVEITTQIGFVDKAIEAVTRLRDSTPDRTRRIDCLAQLFLLHRLQSPSSHHCLDIVRAMGEMVDRDVESEEGRFLVFMFIVLLEMKLTVEVDEHANFDERLSAFTARFPVSKFLRGVPIPSNAGGAEVMRSIRAALGVSNEDIASRLKLLNEIERGSTLVPFYHRAAILGLSFPAFWESATKDPSFPRPLRLRARTRIPTSPPLSPFAQANIPLLDIVSLFIVEELELWPLLFKVFPRIAVAKRTLGQLNEFLLPSPGLNIQAKPASILANLRQNFERILLPESAMESMNGLGLIYNEIAEVASQDSSRFVVYSDDEVFREFFYSTTGGLTISTLDLLEHADQLSHLTSTAVAEQFALLCRQNIGIFCAPRYLVSILPEDLAASASLDEAIGKIYRAELCASLLNSTWDDRLGIGPLSVSAIELLIHMASLPKNNDQSSAALISYWVNRVSIAGLVNTTQVDLSSWLVVSAAERLQPLGDQSGAVPRKLWSIFKLLIQAVLGSRMTVAAEHEAIATVGQMVKQHRQSTVLFDWLALGLTAGTQEWDTFGRGAQRQ